jgi:hypothetical protein
MPRVHIGFIETATTLVNRTVSEIGLYGSLETGDCILVILRNSVTSHGWHDSECY